MTDLARHFGELSDGWEIYQGLEERMSCKDDTYTEETVMKMDGGCHCGNITYTAEIDPENVGICHCTDCQTFSGSAFRTSVRATKDDISVSRRADRKFMPRRPKAARSAPRRSVRNAARRSIRRL